MKWKSNLFSKIILIGILVFSNASFAEGAKGNYSNYNSINPVVNANTDGMNASGRCGVVTFNGMEVVNPNSETICKTDISYGILEMMFQKIFNEWDVFTIFGERQGNTSDSSYAYSIGGPIISVLEAITYLTFLLSGIIFTGVVIRTLNLSAQTGKFMNDRNSLWTVLRLMIAMVLIVPIGSFSLAQIFVLLNAIVAIMLGNYVWGAFLSMQQMNSLYYEDSQLTGMEADGLAQAESMVATELCALRSASAVIEANQKSYEDGLIYDIDVDSRMQDLLSCTRYSYQVTPSLNNGMFEVTGSPMRRVEFINPSKCGSSNPILNSYNSKYHGKIASCGSVSFNTPTIDSLIDSDDKLTQNEISLISSVRTSMEQSIESMNEYDTDGLYQKIKGITKGLIESGKPKTSSTFTSEINSLKEQIYKQINPVFDAAKEKLDKNNPNPKSAYDATYIAATNIYANLMGGRYDHSRWDSLVNVLNSTINIKDGELVYQSLRKVLISPKEEEDMNFQPIYLEAKKASLYIDSMHCAQNWKTLLSKYNSTKEYLEELSKNKNDDFENIEGNISAECLAVLYSDELLDLGLTTYKFNADDYMLGEVLIGNEKDLSNLKNALNLPQNSMDSILSTSINNITTENKNKADTIIQSLSNYFYVVRMASIEALKQVYQENEKEQNNEENQTTLIKMRELGWASAGGFILTIANMGGNLNQQVNEMLSSVSWGNSTVDNSFVVDSQSKSLNTNSKKFDFMSMYSTTNKIFKMNLLGGDSESLSYDQNSILDSLESLITAPTKHLKAVGGFDQSLSLREGVEQCYKYGKCGITNVHPVTALLKMGNDLIDLSITIVLLKMLTSALTLYDMDSKANGTGKVKAMSFMKKILSKIPFLNVLLALITVADFILSILILFVPGLFIVGIFFSFIVPMMPFLAFLMGFIGWVMLILTLLVAVNIWIVLMATPDVNGRSKADPSAVFNFLGQLILKPVLMIVALVFGWYLSAISIYFLNMTIFGALSPTESGSLFGLLDVLIFYIVYLVVVFVAIKHSFKIIESLPDKIFSLVNIKQMNDVKSESLGMERMVQMAAGKQIIDTLSLPEKKLSAKKDAMKKELERREKENNRKAESDLIGDNADALKQEAEARAKEKSLFDKKNTESKSFIDKKNKKLKGNDENPDME